MKVSDLTPGNNVAVELPNTDALALLVNDYNKQLYLDNHGDLDIVQDGRVYRVPAFAEGRQAFSGAKARDCAVWGCE